MARGGITKAGSSHLHKQLDSREEALRMDEEVSLHIKNHAAKGVKRLEERLARFAEQRFCFVVTKVMQG